MSRRRPARGAFPYGSGPIDLGPNPGPTPAWSARLIAAARRDPIAVPGQLGLFPDLPDPVKPDVPVYGTPEWEALPDGPVKVAATVAAAEAWRRTTHPDVVADRLRLELDAARQLAAQEAAEAARLAARNVGEGVAARAGRPSYAELCDLRGEPDRAVAARASEARVGPAFEGMAVATRAVRRHRRQEAERAPAVGGGRG